MEEKKLTGYPSIDKPWLKYYSEEAIHAPLPTGSMYDYMCSRNQDRLDDVALIYLGREITHKQLRKNVDMCAKALIANGVKSGDFVSLCLLAIPEVVYLLYAVNKIGAVCNFLVLNATEKDLHRQIALCDSKLIVTMDMVENKIVNAAIGTSAEKIVSVSVSQSMPFYLSALMKLKRAKAGTSSSAIRWIEFLKSGLHINLPEHQADDLDPAVVEYTGGTTGEPKGVLLSNLAVNTSAFHYISADTVLDFQKGQRFLDIIPPFLAYGLFLGIHMPLCVGLEVVISPDPAPSNFPKQLLKYRPNHFSGGVLHIDSIMNDPDVQRADLSFISTAAYGGDGASQEWEERASEYLRRHGDAHGLLNGYGMTESAGAFCTTTHKTKEMIPFVNNNIKIIDVDSGLELPYGQEGEVCISGPTLMQCYYKNETATEEVMWEENGVRWLHTGDLGYVTEDGYFIISGRIKRIFWSMGHDDVIYRVYPMKIEKVIYTCDMVCKCSVVGKPNADRGFLPIAFIVLQAGTEKKTAVAKIKAVCEAELLQNSWPYEYRIVNTLPVTPAGKIDYRALELEAQKC